MKLFKDYFLTEVKDTKRNRAQVIAAYGLMDHAPEHVAQERAKELIDKWTKLEPMIDPNYDYFRVPSGKQYNPKDIFSWARVSKDLGYDKLEALQNLEAMMINLGRKRDQKDQTKLSEKDYDIIHDGESATVYKPKSMAASCKLGASTKWCTAASQNNQFDSYMAQGVVLFYVITKAQKYNTAKAVWPPQPAGSGYKPRSGDFKPQEKYAIAMYPDGQTMEVFDAEDNKMDWSEWEYIAQELDVPHDRSFYSKHGPRAVDLLKNSVNVAISKMSGQSERDPYDPESNWELLNEVLSHVKRIFREQDDEQLADLEKLRRDEGKPDEVFLMDVLEMPSLEYFLDREYNPVGSYNWGNAQFQQEIVRMISRTATLAKSSNDDDTYNDRDMEEWEEINRKLYGPSDGDDSRNIQHQLRMYISRHLDDNWPELEQALIKLWTTNHMHTYNMQDANSYSETTAEPFGGTMMWLRLMMDVKGGEWPELEQAIHGMIKNTLHNASDMLPRTLQTRKYGLIHMGVNYNLHTNNQRGLKITDYKDWVPSSEEQLKRYADGEWDIDGPPLSDRAKNERQYKGMGEATKHYLKDL